MYCPRRRVFRIGAFNTLQSSSADEDMTGDSASQPSDSDYIVFLSCSDGCVFFLTVITLH